MTSKVLGPIALLVAHWAIVDNGAGVGVHVFFVLKKLVRFVITLGTSVLVDTMVIVQTSHHSVVFEETFSANLTPVWILLKMCRLSVIF